MKPYHKIVIVYLCSGLTWIVLTDHLIDKYLQEAPYLQTLKGTFFVVATTLVLYFLLKYYFLEINEKVGEIEDRTNNELKLNEQLAIESKKLHAVINNSKDFIWSIDKDYKLIVANQAYFDRIKRRFGKDFIRGESVLVSDIPKDVATRWKSYYDQCLLGHSFTVEEAVKNESSGFPEEYIEVSFSPLTNNQDEIIGASCSGRDVTDRKIHELLIESKNKKLLDIAWCQSHELRTPLSRIMGLIYLIEQEYELPEEHKKLLAFMKDASVELDEIIRKVVRMTENLEIAEELEQLKVASQKNLR